MEGFRDDASDFSDKEKEVTEIITNAIQNTFSADTPFNAKKVNEWTNGIVTHCLKELQQLNRPFKYVITCIIMQKNGAGMKLMIHSYEINKTYSSFSLMN
jgi:dynein light chain Tctex-type 1